MFLGIGFAEIAIGLLGGVGIDAVGSLIGGGLLRKAVTAVKLAKRVHDWVDDNEAEQPKKSTTATKRTTRKATKSR